MQFLKTLLIVFTVALAVAFAFNNWTTVLVKLWGGLQLDINLPLLLLLCFLAGLVPTWLWHRAVRWRLNRRLSTTEQAVSDLRTVVGGPTPSAVETDPLPEPGAPPLIGDPRP